MSLREQQVFLIIDEFRSGKYSRADAALKLGCSQRSISRWASRIRKEGVSGIKHKNYKCSPKNKTPDEVKDFYVGLYRQKYMNFNFSHAQEFILEKENPPKRTSYQTFRKWCRGEGLGKVRKRRRAKAYLHRERADNEGFMLQFDGSPHKWNGEDEWTIIAAIDDATSVTPHGEFFPSETTWGCMTVMQKIILKKGIPEFVLTDRAGWSTGSLKRQQFSQFVRACEELGIKVIGTPSAESKGRIERLNRTLQDRLIPEMELLGIKSMRDANRYLEQVFLPDLNKRFSVEPGSTEKSYRRLSVGCDLKDVFCLKEIRLVNRDHTINYKGRKYKLTPPNGLSLWKKEVTVHEYEDKSFSTFYANNRIEYQEVKIYKRRNWAI